MESVLIAERKNGVCTLVMSHAGVVIASRGFPSVHVGVECGVVLIYQVCKGATSEEITTEP